MFFIVTGERPTGRVSITCHKPRAAVERARHLASDGVDDVIIATADGLQFAPGDFARRFIDPA